MSSNFKKSDLLAFAAEEAASSEDERRVTDQTTLMQNLNVIVKIPTTTFSNDFARMLKLRTSDEDIDCTINKLFNFNKFIEHYNKLTPAELSNLVPYIQIYKIYPNETDPAKKIKEFKFNNYFPKSAIDSITSRGSDRGYQANLKNLELNSQGKDTATMYLYDIKMDLVFDSVATLFDEPSADKASYIELFNAQKEEKNKRHNGDPKYYKLLLKFGWNFNKISSDLASSLGLDTQAMKAFTDASKDQLYLNYINHSLNINEDGSVNLSIKYIGSLDVEARNPAALNVLDSLTVAKIKKYQELADQTKKDLKTKYPDIEITEQTDIDTGDVKVKLERPGISFTSDEIQGEDEIRQDLEFNLSEKNKLEINGRDLFLDKIINNISKMLDNSLPLVSYDYRIFTQRKTLIKNFKSAVGTTSKQARTVMKDFAKYSTLDPANFKDSTKIVQSYNGINIQPQDFYKYTFLQQQSYLSIPTYSIRYFPFGVLLKALGLDNTFMMIGTDIKIYNFDTTSVPDTMAEYQIKGEIFENKKNVFIFNNKETKINIFELPVSIAVFKDFFNRNILSKNITSISLSNFLNLCITDLLPNIIQPTNDEYYPKQFLKFKVFYDRIQIDKQNPLYKESERLKDTIASYTDTSSDNLVSFIKPDKTQQTEEKNIIIFYSVPSYFTRKKDLKKDLNSGIPHFHYGEKNSVVNKITFKESTIPYLKESNIQSQVDGGNWKPGVFLRGLYNVTLECIGVVNFRPGTIFYVSPTFTGIKDVSEPIQYGIGGYYMVVSIRLNIESGKFITTVEGRWVATGSGGYQNLINDKMAVVKIGDQSFTVLFDPNQTQQTSQDSIQTQGIFSN